MNDNDSYEISRMDLPHYGIPKLTLVLVAFAALLCAVGSYIGPYQTGGLMLAALSAAFGAFLMTVTGCPFLCLGLLAAFPAAYLIDRAAPLPLWVLTAALASAVLYAAVRKKYSRVITVLSLTGAFLLGFGLYILSGMLAGGEWSLAAAGRVIAGPFIQWKELLTAQGVDEQTMQMIETTLRQVIPLAPAMVFCLFSVCAAILVGAYCFLLRVFGLRTLAPVPWKVSMSFISAVVFTAAFLLCMGGGTDNVVSLTASNLLLILVFPFCWCGLCRFWNRIRQRYPRGRLIFLIFLLIGASLIQPAIVMVIFAVYGAAAVWAEKIRGWLAKLPHDGDS